MVSPDEKSFWDIGRFKITVGWEETYIDATKGGDVDPSVRDQGLKEVTMPGQKRLESHDIVSHERERCTAFTHSSRKQCA